MPQDTLSTLTYVGWGSLRQTKRSIRDRVLSFAGDSLGDVREHGEHGLEAFVVAVQLDPFCGKRFLQHPLGDRGTTAGRQAGGSAPVRARSPSSLLQADASTATRLIRTRLLMSSCCPPRKIASRSRVLRVDVARRRQGVRPGVGRRLRHVRTRASSGERRNDYAGRSEIHRSSRYAQRPHRRLALSSERCRQPAAAASSSRTRLEHFAHVRTIVRGTIGGYGRQSS